MTASDIDRAAEALARNQHGVFNEEQIAERGATRRIIQRRLASGVWILLCTRVYALPGYPPTWFRQLMGAQLSKPEAIGSGRAAAALHELSRFKRGRPEITVPPGSNGRCPLATVHRSSFVEPVKVEGILCNSVRQALFDVAGRVPTSVLTAGVDDALVRRLVTTRELADRCVDLAPTRLQGLPAMRDLLLHRADDYVPPTSQLEHLLYDLLDRLPVPCVRQAAFPWRADGPQRVDALIPAWRVIVEADGRAWHARMDDFARDRDRDRQAIEHGYRPIRYDYWELRDRPDAVKAYLLRIGSQTPKISV